MNSTPSLPDCSFHCYWQRSYVSLLCNSSLYHTCCVHMLSRSNKMPIICFFWWQQLLICKWDVNWLSNNKQTELRFELVIRTGTASTIYITLLRLALQRITYVSERCPSTARVYLVMVTDHFYIVTYIHAYINILVRRQVCTSHATGLVFCSLRWSRSSTWTKKTYADHVV